MKLSELILKDSELTVYDSVYDMETYFYGQADDLWDKTMLRLASLLDVVTVTPVTVNLSDLIESHLDQVKCLFVTDDLDDIMYSMPGILAGDVSEKWLVKFVDALS